jgi:hypothetical protein
VVLCRGSSADDRVQQDGVGVGAAGPYGEEIATFFMAVFVNLVPSPQQLTRGFGQWQMTLFLDKRALLGNRHMGFLMAVLQSLTCTQPVKQHTC